MQDDIKEYTGREVLPHVPDAWVDERKTRSPSTARPLKKRLVERRQTNSNSRR
ncbi:MAG: hypothetical protein HC825_02320 [Oscillatoriales cyanobacterium RM1_1_9]|nr:hypothetical protein [Oscillatoriales cyanobacterium RM1_1_9]